MRFSTHSAEEMCGKPAPSTVRLRRFWVGPIPQVEAAPTREGLFACMRTKDHEGDCIVEAGKAGAADGVRFCCRVMAGSPHAEWCQITRTSIDIEIVEQEPRR